MYKIKLYSPAKKVIKTDLCLFDPNIDELQADAVLIYYDAIPENIEFPQKTYWWSPEPKWHSMYRKKNVKNIKKLLPKKNLLSYKESNIEQRIPHQTHIQKNLCVIKKIREKNVGAVVSNFGDAIWMLRPSFLLRNYFITRKRVSLYGSYDSWIRYPHRLFPKRFQKPPNNYCGEIGGWVYDDKSTIEKLAKFHALICFENSYEPYYFTEKLVFAVAAGCIPIYLPHPTVSREFLNGCYFINPIKHMFRSKYIFEAALNTPIEEVWNQNEIWLKKHLERKDGTREDQLWERVSSLISSRINQL